MIHLRRHVRPALAGLGAALVAEALAAAYVSANDGFGSGDLNGDLRAYAYWNVQFAVYLLALATVLRSRLQIRRASVRTIVWILVGAAAGFLWTWMVAVILGSSIGAFSFPVLYIWTAAGAFAGVALGWSLKAETIPRPGRLWPLLWFAPMALLALVVINVLVLLGSILWNRAEREVFTFPDGFVGQAYVIYDSTAGHQQHARGDPRRYDFPASGLLVTKDDPVQGWLDEHFFYRRADGSQAEIRAAWHSTIDDTEENRADTTVGVYFRTFGHRIDDGCTWRYTSFFVGRKVDVLEERGVDEFESYVDSCVRKNEAPGSAR